MGSDFLICDTRAPLKKEALLPFYALPGLSLHFQCSMWNALQLRWDQVTDSNVTEHATSLPLKVLSCFCSMLWIYLHCKALSNQLCSIWLNLSTMYISQSVSVFFHIIIIGSYTYRALPMMRYSKSSQYSLVIIVPVELRFLFSKNAVPELV